MALKTKEKHIVLEPGASIEYEVLDKTPGGSNLGRAEFTFCVEVKNGCFGLIHIYRKQQRRDDRYYIVKLPKDVPAIGFERRLPGYRRENVTPWTYAPCKQHGTLSMALYVPDNTTKMTLHLSGVQTTFQFE